MGFLKDMKAGTLAQEATKAAESGATLFTPRLNMPSSAHGMSGNITDWAQMVQAVEESGWTMVHWAVGVDGKGRTEAYPVFRR